MFKKITRYLITIAFIIIIISAVVIVYSYTNKDKPEDINEKLSTEMEYLDKQLLSLLNSLNNLDTEFLIINDNVDTSGKNTSEQGSSSSASGGKSSSGGSSSSGSSNSSSSGGGQQSNTQNNSTVVSSIEPKSILSRNRSDIDWQYIQTNLETINNSWATITIDLNSANVPNADILAFNSNMDYALKYVKANDKQNSLISIANLYSSIPKFESNYESNSKKVEIAYIKSDIVSSYAILETNQWDNVSSLLGDTDNRMSNLINSKDNSGENLQKPYVLLKDYIKSANEKDIELCYMKYFYLMKELNNVNE